MELLAGPHRRWNPLLQEWVLVSPHRTQRPWLGQFEEDHTEKLPEYDPQCYLCPGNQRAGGRRNPDYEHTFVFDNDYSALLPDTPRASVDERGLLVAESERGICRVICFSPRHDLTLANMRCDDIVRVVEVWREQYSGLGEIDWVQHVQIFENRGAAMGASNPHPHCQVWANQTLPDYPLREQTAMRRYAAEKGSCLLCDYTSIEEQQRERIVFQNDGFLAVVPFWAVWPFEVLLLSRKHMRAMDDPAFDRAQSEALADALQKITSSFDHVFEAPFPYSMGFHQRPTDGEAHDEWHFHAHFFPPLLRSATIRKFMVGYEMLAAPQRDITPETAAARLREASRK